MAVCDVLSMILFNTALALATILPWLYAVLGMCCTACCKGSRSRLHSSLKVLVNLSWRLAFAASGCSVRFECEGSAEFRKGIASSSGRPRICIQNHTSFLDTMIGVTLFPANVIGDVKMYASEHLFKMPVLGTLVYAMGHLKVPFMTQATQKAAPAAPATEVGEQGTPLLQPRLSQADFSVNKEEMKKVSEEFEEWVGSGKIGCWYPEGRMNPDPKVLQMFRAGGFALAQRIDCEIWCLVTHGNEVCWPRKAAIGGKPCKISGKIFRLTESSLSLCADAGTYEKDRCVAIANKAHDRMQAELDNIISKH